MKTDPPIDQAMQAKVPHKLSVGKATSDPVWDGETLVQHPWDLVYMYLHQKM